MTGKNGAARPTLGRQLTGGVCWLALLLGLITVSPLMGAELKTIDDLAKNLYAGEIRERSSGFAESFAALQAALETLNEGEEISSAAQITRLSGQIAICQQLQRREGEALKSLAGYISDNGKKIAAEGLEQLLPLAELHDKTWNSYDTALTEYLAAYKMLLEYARDNMPALRTGKQMEREQYDRLYNAYVAAVDRQSQVYAEWLGFKEYFSRQYPELKIYMTKQAETINDTRSQP